MTWHWWYVVIVLVIIIVIGAVGAFYLLRAWSEFGDEE